MLKNLSRVGNIIICPKCNAKNFSNAKYCVNCGYIFENVNIKKKNKEKQQKKVEQNQSIKNEKNNPAIPLEPLQSTKIIKELNNKIICPLCKTEYIFSLSRCPKCGYKPKK